MVVPALALAGCCPRHVSRGPMEVCGCGTQFHPSDPTIEQCATAPNRDRPNCKDGGCFDHACSLTGTEKYHPVSGSLHLRFVVLKRARPRLHWPHLLTNLAVLAPRNRLFRYCLVLNPSFVHGLNRAALWTCNHTTTRRDLARASGCTHPHHMAMCSMYVLLHACGARAAGCAW